MYVNALCLPPPLPKHLWNRLFFFWTEEWENWNWEPGALVCELDRNQNVFSKSFVVCASCRGKPFHQSLPAAQVEDFGCNSVQDALYYPHGSLFTYMIYIRSRGVVCTQHGARLSLYNHQHYRMQCVPWTGSAAGRNQVQVAPRRLIFPASRESIELQWVLYCPT